MLRACAGPPGELSPDPGVGSPQAQAARGHCTARSRRAHIPSFLPFLTPQQTQYPLHQLGRRPFPFICPPPSSPPPPHVTPNSPHPVQHAPSQSTHFSTAISPFTNLSRPKSHTFGPLLHKSRGREGCVIWEPYVIVLMGMCPVLMQRMPCPIRSSACGLLLSRARSLAKGGALFGLPSRAHQGGSVWGTYCSPVDNRSSIGSPPQPPPPPPSVPQDCPFPLSTFLTACAFSSATSTAGNSRQQARCYGFHAVFGGRGILILVTSPSSPG